MHIVGRLSTLGSPCNIMQRYLSCTCIQVYAVEASDTAKHATTVVDCNGLSSVVCVIQSRGEELVLPEKVDLIVSEWMGTMLIVSDHACILVLKQILF